MRLSSILNVNYRDLKDIKGIQQQVELYRRSYLTLRLKQEEYRKKYLESIERVAQ